MFLFIFYEKTMLEIFVPPPIMDLEYSHNLMYMEHL